MLHLTADFETKETSEHVSCKRHKGYRSSIMLKKQNFANTVSA